MDMHEASGDKRSGGSNGDTYDERATMLASRMDREGMEKKIDSSTKFDSAG